MTVRGVRAVMAAEGSKLGAQLKARLVLLACLAGPFVFALAIRVQSSVPSDTLFGRAVTDSGLAIPLVVLGFAALWALPAVTSVVGGDMFSAEDRYGTWPALLTRSRTRAELFTGKVLTALGFSLLAVVFLAMSSIAAGLLVIGSQPLIGLSGTLFTAREATIRVALAWASVLPAAAAFTAVAVLVSVWTRSSAAGIGLPVVLAMTMQLYALVDGPEMFRRCLITSGFTAWRGLLVEPSYHGPVVDAAIVSGWYLAVCLSTAYYLLRHRDIR
jgi:ABC-2 type transport system permease protein